MSNPTARSVLDVFTQRNDLSKYGQDGLLLFALELAFDIEDIDSVASSALTEGSDDKKCDLVYVNEDERQAIVAQTYIAEATKTCAPANKASDLNTAASWLLSRQIDELPASLRPAATDLRNALKSEKIDRLYFWYVHNCNEHANVQDELATVELTAVNAIRAYGLENVVQIEAKEIGLSRLQDLFDAATAELRVTEDFEIAVPGGYEIQGDRWQAFATAVPARWLYEAFQNHKDELFSANVRGYLGSRKSDSNINHNIKTSASSSGRNFWAYNNGVTALVRDFNFHEVDKTTGSGTLKITALSIVNGAQTTGAIGSLDSSPASDAFVPARFIKCTDTDTIHDIIRYNNSQNKIEAADFRSTDIHQERLRKEFLSYANYSYRGGRRGGADDKIRRPANLLPSDTVAQLLAAFHQHPSLAYHEKSVIWESDTWYSKFFNESTHAAHIIFLYALYESIKTAKSELLKKPEQQMSAQEKQALDYLRHRGAIFLLVAAFGRTMEIILDRPVPSLFGLQFSNTRDIQTLKAVWEPLVDVYLRLSNFLLPAVRDSLKRPQTIDDGLLQFTSLLGATALSNKAMYQDFARNVQLA